jgi:archaellum biogenesis protein FlaJ (TadC family)
LWVDVVVLRRKRKGIYQMKDLTQIKLILVIYVLLFGSCTVLWAKDIILLLVYNQEPSKYTIGLSFMITFLTMLKLFIQYWKSLIGWSKV